MFKISLSFDNKRLGLQQKYDNSFVMRMIRSCVCLITIELRNEEKHFKQTNNRRIVFLQLFLATQTFFHLCFAYKH